MTATTTIGQTETSRLGYLTLASFLLIVVVAISTTTPRTTPQLNNSSANRPTPTIPGQTTFHSYFSLLIFRQYHRSSFFLLWVQLSVVFVHNVLHAPKKKTPELVLLLFFSLTKNN